MDLLISEELLLLALDRSRGRTAWLEAWRPLAVGVLLDAVDSGAVTLDDDRIGPGAEPEHPLLRRVRAAVTDVPEPRPPAEWVGRLPRALEPLVPAVADRLVARGVLREQPGRVLLFWRTTDLPVADPAPGRALRARLRSVLVDTAEPSAHDVQLITVLHHDHGRIDSLLADDDRATRAAARARAAHLAEHATDRSAVRAADASGDALTLMAVVLLASSGGTDGVGDDGGGGGGGGD